MNGNNHEKSWIEQLGCDISAWVADIAGHPFAQIGIILFCALWWAFRLPTDILTAALSILAITLTQMVLNNQAEREIDVHRRDVAMHAKLDELIAASRRAKNEFVGIEEREEEEIVQLKEEVKEAIEEAPIPGGQEARETVKRAVETAAGELKERSARQDGNGRRKKAASGMS